MRLINAPKADEVATAVAVAGQVAPAAVALADEVAAASDEVARRPGQRMLLPPSWVTAVTTTTQCQWTRHDTAAHV